MTPKIRLNIDKLSTKNWWQVLIRHNDIDYMMTVITLNNNSFHKLVCYEKTIGTDRSILWVHKDFRK